MTNRIWEGVGIRVRSGFGSVYGPGIDEPLCMIDVAGGNAVYYYHFDGLGSVVALSDVNSVIVERYSYDVFGAPTIYDANDVEIPQRTVGNPYLFTARRADDETALYYYRARYYAFDIGRFLQPDPVGYADSLNLYTYCGNNPANWVDPWGTGTVAIGGGGILGTIVGGATQEGYVMDLSGNIGYYEMKAVGAGTPSLGVFGAVTVTSAEQVTDLSGMGGQGGASFFYGGGEFLFGGFGLGQKGYYGVEGSLGINLIPAEGHGHITRTNIRKVFNLKDIYRNPTYAATQYLRLQGYLYTKWLKKQTSIDEMLSLIGFAKDLSKDNKSEKKGS